jgi:hypothetical protein
LVVILSGAGTFSYGADGQVASVLTSPSEIIFDPVLRGEKLSLTVGGEGGLYVQRDYDAGETPSFQTGSLPNGSYKYELRTIPEDDSEEFEQEQMIVQSGAFQIENGAIVLSSGEDDSVE